MTFALTLTVYLLTLPPDLTWANQSVDGGELITAAVTLGVPHPPGYPTYVLLGKLFSRLPVGTVAYRFNLLSAVCVALAAALTTSIGEDVPKTPYPESKIQKTFGAEAYPKSRIASSLLFAFAPLVWGQAIVAEVYGLNLLLVAAVLWATLNRRPAWLRGLLLGLSLTTHLTSLLLLPIVIVATKRAGWPALAAGFLAGLAPFAVIPWLAQSGSPVVWGEPTTWGGWWWLVSGRLYHDNVLALPVAEWLPRAQQWLLSLTTQFTWFGLPLLLVGTRTAASEDAGPSSGRLVPFLWLAVAAYGLYAFSYRTKDALVTFLPGLLVLSILLRPGLRLVGHWALLLPLLSLALNLKQVDLSGVNAIRPSAETILREAPPAAVLLTPGDPSIFTLWYFQHVEGQRPDLTLVDSNLLAFDWYRRRLGDHDPALQGLERDDLDDFVQKNLGHRPLCRVSLSPPANHSCLKDSS